MNYYHSSSLRDLDELDQGKKKLLNTIFSEVVLTTLLHVQ